MNSTGGTYSALEFGKILYNGNNIHQQAIIDYKNFKKDTQKNRVKKYHEDEAFFHLNKIDNIIFNASVDYFRSINAWWTNLPLTTLMISSPGEVYAGKTLDYTTDALPIEIKNRFSGRKIFLAESSQFYLELALLKKGINQVFSIYNSFRKEKSDATHLSEFQHIEYEGKIQLEENIKIFTNLFNKICNDIFEKGKESLQYFLTDEIITKKQQLIKRDPVRITLKNALELLKKETGEEKYGEFSLKHFHTREEVKLTEILGSNVIVEEFPLLEIPFYHNAADKKTNGIPVAKNADLILHGYRETIGAGERIRDKETLMQKAKIFNLPKEDYLPYVQSRDFDDYAITSGFGLGRQRLTQWITNQPFIYEATSFPRTHLTPNP